MPHKSYLVVIFVVITWYMAGMTIRAFHMPWRWTLEQCAVAVVAIAWGVALLSWGLTWVQGGTTAVRVRWMGRQEKIARNNKAYEHILTGRNFAIAVAAGFLVMFVLVLIQTIYFPK